MIVWPSRRRRSASRRDNAPPSKVAQPADHDAVARRRVDELPAAEVDSDVRRSGLVRLEEHEVAGDDLPLGRVPGVVLRVGGARQVDAEHREDVLHVARAVEPVDAGSPERVGNADKAHRAARQPHRDRRRAVDDTVCKAADRRCVRVLGTAPHMARSACEDGLLGGLDLAQLRGGIGRDRRRRRERVGGLLIEGKHLADDEVVGVAALQLVESGQIVDARRAPPGRRWRASHRSRRRGSSLRRGRLPGPGGQR